MMRGYGILPTLVGGLLLILPVEARQTPRNASLPPAIEQLLERAASHLSVSKPVSSVRSLHVTGTRNRAVDTRLPAGVTVIGSSDEPYEFRLHLPDRFQWRSGDVLHSSIGGMFSQNIHVDEQLRKTAMRSHRYHLMVVCLAFLARLPPGISIEAEDRAVQDFVWVKGHTIRFHDRVERIGIELVLDAETARPLALVSRGVSVRADGSSLPNDFVELFEDYREVSGIRFPHRIEQWSHAHHARVTVAHIAVDSLKSADFLESPPSNGR